MNTRIFIIILAVSFGLMIFGAVIGGIFESSGTVTRETLSPKTSITILIIYFMLFCAAAFAFVPLVVRFFIVMQIKIGNGEFFLIKWFQVHEHAVIYGLWIFMVVGLCIALPAAIKDGFFR